MTGEFIKSDFEDALKKVKKKLGPYIFTKVMGNEFISPLMTKYLPFLSIIAWYMYKGTGSRLINTNCCYSNFGRKVLLVNLKHLWGSNTKPHCSCNVFLGE